MSPETGTPDASDPGAESEQEPLAELVEELRGLIPFSARVRNYLEQAGALTVMSGRVIARSFKPPFELGAVVYQIEMLGARSLPIATLTAVFAGLVIALQFGSNLAKFGVQHTVGRIVVLTLFRELAPVLTALTVGGRIGSGIAAELGSMTVTEQVDAVRALGADPLKKLMVPRFLACLIVLPALTVFSDVFGMMAGAAVVQATFSIPYEQFFQSAVGSADLLDFGSGVFKGGVFGAIIALVGCYKGVSTTGGTEGVGTATTETVAVSSVAVCLADFFVTKILLAFE